MDQVSTCAHAGGHQDAQAGGRGSDPRAGRPGVSGASGSLGGCGIARNSVRRYLAGATVGFQERPAARRLDDGHATRSRTTSSAPSPRGTPSSSSRNSPPEGSTSSSAPCSGPSPPSARSHAPEALATVRFETPPGQQMQIDFGEKVVRDRRRAREGLPHDRRPGLLAAALLPGLPRPAPGRLARGHRRGFPPFRRPHRADPLRQRLAAGHLPRSPRPARSSGIPASRPSARIAGSTPRPAARDVPAPRGRSNAASATSSTTPWPGDRSPRSRTCSGTWRSGWSRSPIGGSTARPANSPIVRFERDERQALRPLPARPLAVRTRRLKRRVSADCFVDIDTIRYSVPHRHVREHVEVVVGTERVEIWLRGALHRRPSAVVRAGRMGPQPGALRGAVPPGDDHRTGTGPARRDRRPGGAAAVDLRRDGGRGPAMSTDLDPVEERVIATLEAAPIDAPARDAGGGALRGGQGAVDLPGVPRPRSCGARWTPSRASGSGWGCRSRTSPASGRIEGFDFAFQPSVDERLIRELSTGNFIAHGENGLMFGPPGRGKVAPGDRPGPQDRRAGPHGAVHDGDGAVGGAGEGGIGREPRRRS